MRRISILTPIIAVVAIAALLAGCTAPPAPTPVPPQAEATTIPTPAPAPADLWEQIQKSGRMTVGTAADYAPFEYYNSRFQLDGFDIGLIREIGKQLGVKVEIKDYAFDGLYNALQLGQIDVAIAAISETPDRQQYVDFTNSYYAGVGAVLANAQSAITSITQPEQLATQRVGVQSGSVYETFMQDTLVDTKQMPASNLYSYPDIEHAVKDLKNKRIDLVLLDNQPAQTYVQQGGVKLVGEGIDPQLYAMAIPKGADSFRRVLDKALTGVVDSGAYAELAAKHLGLDQGEVAPVPTPVPAQPTPTPAPNKPTPTAAPAACIDGMSYVADITYDDANMTAPPVLQARPALRQDVARAQQRHLHVDQRVLSGVLSRQHAAVTDGRPADLHQGQRPARRHVRHLGQPGGAAAAGRLPGLLADGQRQGNRLRHDGLRRHPGGGPHRRAGADANAIADASASPSTRPTSRPASASPSAGTSRTSRRSTSTRKGRT